MKKTILALAVTGLFSANALSTEVVLGSPAAFLDTEYDVKQVYGSHQIDKLNVKLGTVDDLSQNNHQRLNKVSSKADTLEWAASDSVANVNRLGDELNKEIRDRKSEDNRVVDGYQRADTALRTEYQGADLTLKSRIDGLAGQAQGNTDGLAKEVQDRKSWFTELQNGIVDVGGRVTEEGNVRRAENWVMRNEFTDADKGLTGRIDGLQHQFDNGEIKTKVIDVADMPVGTTVEEGKYVFAGGIEEKQAEIEKALDTNVHGKEYTHREAASTYEEKLYEYSSNLKADSITQIEKIDASEGDKLDLVGFTGEKDNLVYTGDAEDKAEIQKADLPTAKETLTAMLEKEDLSTEFETNIANIHGLAHEDVEKVVSHADDKGLNGAVDKQAELKQLESDKKEVARLNSLVDAGIIYADKDDNAVLHAQTSSEAIVQNRKSVNTNADEITRVESKTDANSNHIEALESASIKGATKNTAAISGNTAEIKRVDTYAQESRGFIETNAGNIEQNKSDIYSNRKAISGNTAAIGKNTADIKDLRQNFENLSKDYYSFKEQTNGAIAGVAAMGQLAQPYGVGNFNVGVAVGDYSGQQAIAVGMGYRYSENVTVRAAAAANSGNNMEPILAASVNYEW